MATPFNYSLLELRQLYDDYKKHRSTQFDIRKELLKTGERAGEVIDVKLPKPLTIASFCLYIDTTEVAFKRWIDKYIDDVDTGKVSEDIKDVCKFIAQVREEIKDMQLSGAVNGVYNERIVSRLNGLTDKQEVEVTTQIQSIILPVPTK